MKNLSPLTITELIWQFYSMVEAHGKGLLLLLKNGKELSKAEITAMTEYLLAGKWFSLNKDSAGGAK